ncbi:MAG: phage virion morphogenesis protein [Allosphingosinicella sp.]|uniref:phage virion morphogenesis protein n=1 Tax=Allosphingosinicella sp. TaxID=2823234 RepID=UPI003948D462
MSGAVDSLEELEQIAGKMIAKLDSGERRKLLRRMARDVQTSQGARIGAQQSPDGARYAPRRPGKPPVPGGYAVSFLYPKGAAEPRKVIMKSWVREGPLMTGYDIEAGGIRSFFWDKVAKWLPVPPEHRNAGGGAFRRKGRIRRQAMFRRIRSRRFLLTGASDREAWIGFAGRVAQIARIHQEGGTDRPSQGGPSVRYPRRELLGLSEAERTRMLDSLLDHRLFGFEC